MGTSSSLFNQAVIELNNTNVTSQALNALKSSLTSILTSVGEANNDIAIYYPNPFYRYQPSTNENAQTQLLTLVDGGEDLQNIPLQPLLQPARQVDVIFAIDSSADTESNWPDGTSLVKTYERSLDASGIANGTAFPSIPGQNTFINLGLNTRPTFFGCNSSNMTGNSPLIVYLPNFPYSYYSNVSTFELEYNNTVRNAIVTNGYDVVTMANGTLGSTWPTCVGCAILGRIFERTKTVVPEVCQKCFAEHCWDGTINETVPLAYEPTLALASSSKNSGAPRPLQNGWKVATIPTFLAGTLLFL